MSNATAPMADPVGFAPEPLYTPAIAPREVHRLKVEGLGDVLILTGPKEVTLSLFGAVWYAPPDAAEIIGARLIMAAEEARRS